MTEYRFEKLTLTSGNNNTLTVTGCESDAVDVLIPDEVEGIPVAKIAHGAFNDCNVLVSVTVDHPTLAYLEAGATFEIDGNAFTGCSSLTSISIPDDFNWVRLGHGAFYRCYALEKADIPAGSYLEGYVFSNCESLREVPPLRRVPDGCFSHCKSLTSLPVTSHLTEIGDDAFEHCDGLVNITIPASTRRIGDLAFRGCQGLQSVTFERPEGWFVSSRYGEPDKPLELSDPSQNAHWLSHIDFDDGPTCWFRKKGDTDEVISSDNIHSLDDLFAHSGDLSLDELIAYLDAIDLPDTED